MSEWTENFENDIKIQIEGIKRLDAGFMNVRLLNNTAKKIDEFSKECSTCKQYKLDYEEILPEVVKRIEESEFRDNYERKLVEVSKHLEQEHQLMPKGYFTSFYTFVGLLLGLAFGAGIAFLIQKDFLYTGLFWGGFAGVFVGRLFGLLKDKNLAKIGKSI